MPGAPAARGGARAPDQRTSRENLSALRGKTDGARRGAPLAARGDRLKQGACEALMRPRTSLGELPRDVGGSGDALSRVASFMGAGRASLAPEALAKLTNNRSKSASSLMCSHSDLSGAQSMAWGQSDARSVATRKPETTFAGGWLPEVRPKTSMGTYQNDTSADSSLLNMPLRPKSVTHLDNPTLQIGGTFPLKNNRAKLRGKDAIDQDNVRELERYAQYMEECTSALEDRLHMHVPLHIQIAVTGSRTGRTRSTSIAENGSQHNNTPFPAQSTDLCQDPTKSNGDFNDIEFDRNLAMYLAEVRKQSELPTVVTRLQKWWRMRSQRRKFQRFKIATRIFTQRAMWQMLKGWQFVALAESWMRGAILSHHLSAWRMLARNSSNWSEESALIFVECMRAECALQQALFLECNDKRIFRRAGLDYNWGRGWKFGRPLPTREHVMVVQALRRKIIWSARMRIRRWKKYVLWRESQRSVAAEKLRDLVESRLMQKFALQFIMWRRWAVVIRCEKKHQQVPDFDLDLPIWNDWYKKHLINRMQDDKRQIDEGEVQSLKWRFLCRAMWVSWTKFIEEIREDRETGVRIKVFNKRKAQEIAFGGWADVKNMHKAIRHRYVRILNSLRDFASMRLRHKRASSVVSSKWQHRCLGHILNGIRKVATYMLVINAGGLNRILRNGARGKWAMYAWLANGLPIDGPQRKPGGLCLLGVCDGHFYLLDCWRRWSSKARRRLRMKKLVFSGFYEEAVYTGILPVFNIWRQVVQRAKSDDGTPLCPDLPIGREKIAAYQRWVNRVRKNELSGYCLIWTLFPRVVGFMMSHTEQRKQMQQSLQQLDQLTVKERMDRRKAQLEQEMGAGGKNPSAHFPMLRDFVLAEKHRQPARCANNLKALKRDYKLLITGELNDIVRQYSTVYELEYQHHQGKNPVPFKSNTTQLFGSDETNIVSEQTWFPESMMASSDGRTASSAKFSRFPSDGKPEGRQSCAKSSSSARQSSGVYGHDEMSPGAVGPMDLLGSSVSHHTFMDDESFLAPLQPLFSAHVVDASEQESVEPGTPIKRKQSTEVQQGEDDAELNVEADDVVAVQVSQVEAEVKEAAESPLADNAVVSMWDYQEKGTQKDPKQILQEQVAASLKVALDEMYDKLLIEADQKRILPRPERLESAPDPYFDVAYPERQKALREHYDNLREQELGPRSTYRLLELEGLNISGVHFAEELEEIPDGLGPEKISEEEKCADGLDGKPFKSRIIEDHIISASFGGTFYGINVAMDLEAPIATAMGTSDEVQSTIASGRPRRKNGASDALYSEAIRAYRARADASSSSMALGTILESPNRSNTAALVRQSNSAAVTINSGSMSRPASSRELPTSRSSSSHISRSDSTDPSKVVTRIPSIQISKSGADETLDDSLEESREDKVLHEQQSGPSSPLSSAVHGEGVVAHRISSAYSRRSATSSGCRPSSACVGSSLDLLDDDEDAQKFSPLQSSSTSALPGSSRSVRIDAVDEDANTSSSASSRTGTENLASAGETHSLWDSMIAENGWIQQEVQDITEALRGDLDSLYWRSQVISKRSKRQRAVQMAIDKDFAFSKALYEARLGKMNSDLLLNEINNLASLDDTDAPNRIKAIRETGKLERGFTNRRKKPPLRSKSSLNELVKIPKDNSEGKHSMSQVLCLPNTEDRDFLRISVPSSSNPATKVVVDDEYRMEAGHRLPVLRDLNPTRSLTDLMLTPDHHLPPDELTSKHIPTPSLLAKPVPRFNEEARAPKMRIRPQSVLQSTPIEEELSDLHEVSCSEISKTYTSLHFPAGDSDHVAGGARVARNSGSGSVTSRKHVGLGKLAVALERPHTERSSRPGSMVVTGDQMNQGKPRSGTIALPSRPDSRASNSKMSSTASLMDSKTSIRNASTIASESSFVHEFGKKPSAKQQAAMLIGGSRVGTVKLRSFNVPRPASNKSLLQEAIVMDTITPFSDVESDLGRSVADQVDEAPVNESQGNMELAQSPETFPEEQYVDAETVSKIHFEQQRSSTHLETLWQPWGRMEAHNILAELCADDESQDMEMHSEWDKIGPKDILQMCSAFGADGQIDLSQQLRPPASDTVERLRSTISQSSQLSITTDASSRPESAHLSVGTSSRPVSGRTNSRPVSALLVSPTIVEDKDVPAIVEDKDVPDVRTPTETLTEIDGWGLPNIAFMNEVDSAPEHKPRTRSKKADGFSNPVLEVRLKKHPKFSSAKPVADTKQSFKPGLRRSWTGVVKEEGHRDSAAAGPYLSVKSVKPTQGTVAAASLLRHRSIHSEEKAAAAASAASKANFTAEVSKQTSISSNLADAIENAAKVAATERKTAVQNIFGVDKVDKADEAAQNVKNMTSEVKAMPQLVEPSIPSPKYSFGNSTPDDRHGDFEDVHLPQWEVRCADTSPHPEEIEDSPLIGPCTNEAGEQAHALALTYPATVTESAIEAEKIIPLEKEASEHELKRAHELLLDDCNSDAISKTHTDDNEEEVQLSEFQKYVNKLGNSEDKIDQFEEGLKVKIKQDASRPFSSKGKKRRASSVQKRDTAHQSISAPGVDNKEVDTEGQSLDTVSSDADNESLEQLVQVEALTISVTSNPPGEEMANLSLVSPTQVTSDAKGREGMSERTSEGQPNQEPGQHSGKAEKKMIKSGQSSYRSMSMHSSPRHHLADTSDHAHASELSDSEQSDAGVGHMSEREFFAVSVKTRKRAPTKKQVEMDLFKKFRDNKFTKKLQAGVNVVVPEWKKMASFISVPSARRVVLSSSESSESGDEPEEIHDSALTSVMQPEPSSKETSDEIMLKRLDSQSEDPREVAARRQEHESIAVEIARRQYDTLYGSAVLQHGPSWRGRGKKSAISNSQEDFEGPASYTHWSKDRRLKQAHTADRYYEALRLRQGGKKFGSTGDSAIWDVAEEEEELRMRLLLGSTSTTPVGQYDTNLGRVRSQKDSVMHVLQLKDDDLHDSIETLPRVSAPRPGDVALHALPIKEGGDSEVQG